jgi:hypothetical protein
VITLITRLVNKEWAGMVFFKKKRFIDTTGSIIFPWPVRKKNIREW